MTAAAGSTLTDGEQNVVVESGSNREHHLSRADWRFLLPSLSGARVLVLGAPQAGELAALCSAATLVVVVSGSFRKLQLLRAQTAGVAPGRAVFIHGRSDASLPLRSHTFELVAVVGKLGYRDLAWPCAAQRDTGRVLAPNGRVHIATRVAGGSGLARFWLRRCVGAGHRFQAYCAIWRKGSMRAALPIGSPPVVAQYLFRNVLYGRSRTGRGLTRVAVALARMRVLDRMVRDRALVARSAGATPAVPFNHVVRLARRHGHDLAGHAVALLTSGSYDSNKNAFLVFRPGEAQPWLIVKVTRTAAFNHRLHAEHDALRLLHERRYVPAGTYPEALFIDCFGELAVLGQQVVHGVPFRRATTARVDCPAARRGIDWVTQLGMASATVDAGNRARLAARLDALLDRVTHAYRLTASEHAFLAERLRLLATGHAGLPQVFRHGDAGTWNVLITPAGEAAFLDWEVSEHAGPPLWDLLDFVRSHGSWIARVAGETDPVAGYVAMFMREGAVLDLQLDSVAQYRAATGVHQGDVEALFYGYWLDRANRQAAWAAGPLADASYIRLLRSCIEQRGSPGLRRLLD